MTGKKATVAVETALNFVVVGALRAGTAVVQSSLDQSPGVVCHGDLLFSDYGSVAEQDAVRRRAHEAYFGPCRAPSKLREWFHSEANPYRYLTDTVFDNPRGNEDRIGVRLNYDLISRFELYDLLAERWREGDFCAVHVNRNPIACMVSAAQARRSGVWRESAAGPAQDHSILAVRLEPADVVAHVRHHVAVSDKVRASCKDLLEVNYRDLVFRFDAVMSDVFEFLEIPQQKIPRPSVRRMRNRAMPDRISNYCDLKRELPGDVRRLLAEDLF